MSEMDYEVLFAEAAQGLGQPRREAAVRAARVGSKRSFRIAARARRPLALAHAAAPRPLARRRVRLCTRGIRRCAQTDRNGAILPVSCPFVHTPIGGVCTNGHVIARIGIHVSGKAHARASRVHKRTRAARYGRARVRLCTRHKAACALMDTSCPHSPCGRPLVHSAAQVACECGHRGAGTDLRASGKARVWPDAPRLRRPPTRSHTHAAASVARGRAGRAPYAGAEHRDPLEPVAHLARLVAHATQPFMEDPLVSSLEPME
jgi:hypothetical protein